MINKFKNKPTGDYEVGYRKPPVHSRFRPGRSGNPRGRRRGSKNRVSIPLLFRLRSILLQEAYRSVTINDPNGKLKMPMARAVVRSIAHNAVKGNARAQRLFTSLIESTERDDRQLHEDCLRAALEYKMEWERELEERKRAGISGPEPVPHPDDIFIDNYGIVHVKGPKTKQEKAVWDRLRERKKECDLAIADYRALLKEEPDPALREIILRDIEFEQNLKRRILALIPD